YYYRGTMGQITDSYIRGLNPQYQNLPIINLNANTSLHIIFMMHRMVNSNIIYNPGSRNSIKSYKDAKTTIFSNFISR
ncbi:MAG: hypothetical protein ABIW47_01770, partial [Ginsengibacter sp.]